jgi:putative spermidine/putrescine transport system permease protein
MIRRIGLRTVAASVFLGPILVLAIGALSVRWFFPQVVPNTFTLDGVRRVGFASKTIRAAGEGLWLSALVTIMALVIGWPAARVLSRATGAVRWMSGLLLLLPSVLPAVGLAIGLDVALLRLPFTHGITAVALAHLVPTVPYSVAMLTAVFARHDSRSEQQATVLGANRWQVWRMVTFPMVRSGLSVAAVLTFLVSWSQYLITLLVGGGRVVTLPMLVFTAATGGNTTTIGVLALFAALPGIVLLTFVSRRLTHTISET